MKKHYLKVSRWLLAALCLTAAWPSSMAQGYGLPANIQDGNILHCFNWPASAVKAELPAIAAAGFGSVQLSPLQRPDVSASGSPWHDLYRPYDLAFKSSGFCSEQDLKDLCAEAANYGIKVIVDVVANHVDKTAGYHDTWWDSNGRVRWNGGINYGDRYSVTHGQLGDYGDVNSEDSEVQARGKAYIEFLKSCGVKGIRWDAAKHIATPSEGCGFWSAVTSVSGMWHYGEILNDDGSPINEYANYMSVTDNRYSNGAAQYNGGIQQGYAGEWVVSRGVADNKMVYWAESHDTYSNDDWSMNVDQSVIDRAYACVATRCGATALYLSRPNTKGFNNIKTGKGSTAFKSAAVTAVNKLRNVAGSARDYVTSTGDAFSCTREGVGAVIVMKGSGNISIANGGGYCPAGTYTDVVSGGQFTVTSSTISGNVGSSGIAVIYKGGSTVGGGDVGGGGTTGGTAPSSLYILGNLANGAGWGTTPGTGVAMTKSGDKFTASNVTFELASGETTCYFNLATATASSWDALNQAADRYGASVEGAPLTVGQSAAMTAYPLNVSASGCLSWTIAPGTYDITADFAAMTLTVSAAGTGGGGGGTGGDTPTTDKQYCYFINSNGWTPYVWAWNANQGDANCNANGTWPGDLMIQKDGKYYWEAPAGKVPTHIIISNNGNEKAGGGGSAPGEGDLVFQNGATYNADGTIAGGGTTGGTAPSSLYILGNLANGAGWGATPGIGVAMTKSGNKFTAYDVEFELAAGETSCFFNLATATASSWDALNQAADRYGASVEGAPLTVGQSAAMTAYPLNVSASGCLSWTIAPGQYTITADFDTMTVTATTTALSTGNVDFDEDSIEPIYYNLQGVKIENPTPGLYIVVRGHKVTKEMIK